MQNKKEYYESGGCGNWIFLAFLCFAVLTLSVSAAQKPNIVLIMADDLGYECIRANGAEDYQTPSIDKLAEEGMRFTNCFSNPICTPSRVKIMTGVYNIRNYVKFGILARGQKTFAHVLKDHGYRTCIAGKWQLGREPDAPQHFGFEEALLWQHTRPRCKDGSEYDSRYPNPYLEHNGKEVNFNNGEYGPDVITDFILNYMEEHKNEPFAIYYPMLLTHCPFVPTSSHPDYDPKSPGSKSYKGGTKYFKPMVEHMDKAVGRIITKLEQLKLRDNTLVIFTADNGTDKPVVTNWNGRQIPGGKGKLKDTGTRVPLVVSYPKVIPAGRVSDELVDFTDIMPTLCDFAAIPPARRPLCDGASLYPSLLGTGARNKSHVYIWYSQGVLARNKTHLMLRGRYENDPTLYDVSIPFTHKEVEMTEKHQGIFKELLSVIEDKDSLRPAELIAADKREIQQQNER